MSGYDKQIKEIAEKLAYGDSFLAEELRSEMDLSVLTSKLADRETVLSIARLKAVDYLDKKEGISGAISYNG